MLGTKIKTLRRQHKLNQEVFAERIGVSRATLSRWERSEAVPDSEQIARIADALEVSVRYLLGEPEPESEPDGDELVSLMLKMNDNLTKDIIRRKTVFRRTMLVLISIVSIILLWVAIRSFFNNRNEPLESSEMTDIFQNTDEPYPTDFIFAEQFETSWVRIYREPAYYREIDGEKYIAVTFSSSQHYIAADVMNQLHVGDILPIDRDVNVLITELKSEPEWEDKNYPAGGIMLPNGKELYREKGRITINEEYFFVRPYCLHSGDDYEYEFNAYPFSWILYRKEDDGTGDSGYAVELYNTCRWVKVSDECQITLWSGDRAENRNIHSILESINEYYKDDDEVYVIARVTSSGREITGIQLWKDESNE